MHERCWMEDSHPGEAPRLKLGQILLSMSLAAGHYRIPIMGYDIINPYKNNGEYNPIVITTLNNRCLGP